MSNKIIRTICAFTDHPEEDTISYLDELAQKAAHENYLVQTKRICTPAENIEALKMLSKKHSTNYYYSIGTLSLNEYKKYRDILFETENLNLNLDLTHEEITMNEVEILFDIIDNAPSKTFNFTYVFNNENSSPYMPSASYDRNGFSVGLQPTDLSEGCENLQQWFERLSQTWKEIVKLYSSESDFLGIDSSIAPLFEGKSSLVHFLKSIGYDFSQSFTTDVYTQITKFIKEENPKPIGLNGLMMPCLEDFELAKEYEEGNFSIERNIFVSLHSGLGIDTYPIAVDESKEKVLEILKLLQALSNKHNKALSARFVSDGKAKVGEKTDFQNQYLYDVKLNSL